MNKELLTIYVHVLKREMTVAQYYSWMDAYVRSFGSLDTPEPLTASDYHRSKIRRFTKARKDELRHR